MIPKHELITIATQSGLHLHVIEKDYVLGWLLAGIHHHPELQGKFLFKGGTCIKKCYLNEYRFSEDLDFTLCDPSQMNAKFLNKTLHEVGKWVQQESGIEIILERTSVELFPNLHGFTSCEGKIYYRGPASPTGNSNLPRIKLDLTATEIITDTPELRAISHPYSDKPPQGLYCTSYSFIEIFAEKMRALGERTRPRDLYDIVTLFAQLNDKIESKLVYKMLDAKSKFKNIPVLTLESLNVNRANCSGGWNDQLSHQLPNLPPFEDYWKRLPEIFSWLKN